MDLNGYKTDIEKCQNLKQLEEIKIKYLGRNGLVNQMLSKIKEIPSQQKKEYGQKVNLLKKEIEQAINEKQKELEKNKTTKFFDSTLPGKLYPKGSLHPLTYIIEEISNIFQKIGFVRVSYPEVEWEYFSFEALNMPKGHPGSG
jgi:Phenylalanyl-tRNA synthetase alpha subunit